MQPLNMTPLLRADALSRQFAGLRALDAFSFELRPGEIVGIIGPNGAGKTTAFNVLTGFLQPTSGTITLGEQLVMGLDADQIARLGVARTFQNIRLFRRLSVLDNVLITAQQTTDHRPPTTDHRLQAASVPGSQFFSMLLSLPTFRRREQALREEALDWLELFGLRAAANQRADSLAYGDQRRLEIARAMAGRPRVLLLDEPAAGMNHSETDDLLHLIRSLRDRFGVAVVLVEHDMSLVMRLCERILVLNYGKLIASGTPAEISNNPDVITAYLGTA